LTLQENRESRKIDGEASRRCLKAKDARQNKKQQIDKKRKRKRAHVETPAARAPNLFRAVSSPVPL
jgi:hypothetical protein